MVDSFFFIESGFGAAMSLALILTTVESIRREAIVLAETRAGRVSRLGVNINTTADGRFIKRDFPYYVRRISVASSIGFSLYTIDPHGAYGVFYPPINDLITCVDVLLGWTLYALWVRFNVNAIYGMLHARVPASINVTLVSVPVVCYVAMSTALVCEWVFDKRWFIGFYNVAFAGGTAALIALILLAYAQLRALLVAFKAETTRGGPGVASMDMSHIDAALRTLRIFASVVTPVACVIVGFLLLRAHANFTEVRDQNLTREPVPQSFGDVSSSVIIYFASFILFLLVLWFAGFPKPKGTRVVDQTHTKTTSVRPPNPLPQPQQNGGESSGGGTATSIGTGTTGTGTRAAGTAAPPTAAGGAASTNDSVQPLAPIPSPRTDAFVQMTIPSPAANSGSGAGSGGVVAAYRAGTNSRTPATGSSSARGGSGAILITVAPALVTSPP